MRKVRAVMLSLWAVPVTSFLPLEARELDMD